MNIVEKKKILVLKKKIKNNLVVLEPMSLKNLNKFFISSLNKKKVNQFTQIKYKIQDYDTCYKYFLERLQNKELYYSINTNKNKFIGTLTLREIKKKTAYFGILIFNTGFHGSEEVKIATNIFLNYCFKNIKLNSIKAVTYKNALGANFLYLSNNFKKFKADKRYLHFKLNKKDIEKKYKFKIINE